MKKKFDVVCRPVLLMALVCLLVWPVQRAGAANVVQTSTQEQTVVIFMDKMLDMENLTCKVSNQPVEIVESGGLTDGTARVKTTVLIDVSKSIPADMHEKLIAAINKLIEQKAANDEYRIITFAEEQTQLCDFTTDRYDLNKAIEGLAFDKAWSKIYDAVYSTMPTPETGTDTPILYRSILITDGVDEADTGAIMEELLLKLQNERYPVDVLAVSGSSGAANKELSAITRVSGGRYCGLAPDTDLESLEASLGVSGYSYVKIQAPEQLLDGSIRQVDLSDGTVNMSLDVKFAAADAQIPQEDPPVETEPPVESEPVQETEPPVETAPEEQTAAPVESVQPEETAAPETASLLEGMGFIPYIVLGTVVVLIVVVVFAISGKRDKNGRKRPDPKPNPEPERPPRQNGSDLKPSVRPTVVMDENEDSKAQYQIKLSAPKHPGQEWVLKLVDELLIGRAEHCRVQFTEQSVSREQCKIILKDGKPAIVHMGTNKTTVNGVKVEEAYPLNAGDVIKIGREELRIDYIQKIGAPEQKPPTKGPSAGIKTDSFF